MRKFIIFFIKYNDEQNLVESVETVSPDKATDFINLKNSIWIKGQYASTYHVMTAPEALQYVIDVIKRENEFKLEDYEERINNLLSKLKECYGIDYKSQN